MKNLRIRCSSLGKIMTAPKNKGEVLSVGAKTYIRELAREDIFGVEVSPGSKQMEKGTRCEDASISLYNEVFGTSAAKNTERRTDDIITGECDFLLPSRGVDIKTSWSIASFPILSGDCEDSLYMWQARGYMRLWDRQEWQIAFCLVDTPDDLIGYEPLSLHIVSHIPANLRLTTWTIKRDMEAEALMVEKVQAARLYYAEVLAEFDRTHGGVPAITHTTQAASTAPAELV